jgi:ABC-2 type transport system ATP-binding protein
MIEGDGVIPNEEPRSGEEHEPRSGERSYSASQRLAPPLDRPPPLLEKPLVSVQQLSRMFDQVHAVKGASFEIYPGQVVGFIGANGAGKTTTMRLMATLDYPTAGQISIGGYDVVQQPEEVRRLVGWMPDSYGTYDNMTVREYLDFFGRAYGLKRAERLSRLDEVMEFADLTSLADRPMGKLSKGMGQRLCFGRMLMHDPEFLIMDEPAAGLDPKARLEFKNLVRILKQRGKTQFISSHILSELGEMCDTLLFIDAGKVVYHGAADTLKRGEAGAHTIINIKVAGDTTALVQWAAVNPGWSLIEETQKGARLRFDSDDETQTAASLKRMIMEGIPVVEFHREERRLEDAFVDMLKKTNGGA